jgi:hypothetical protein
MGSGNDDVGRDMSHARPLRFSTTQIRYHKTGKSLSYFSQLGFVTHKQESSDNTI